MKKIHVIVFVTAMLLALIWYLSRIGNGASMHHFSGQTMGTITYNVKYVGESLPIESEIADVLGAFNQSLSTYIPDSEISKLNSSGSLNYESEFFYPVLAKSREVYDVTDGTFDPSIGPLIRAWGFGPEKDVPELDSSQVDSLRKICGFDQVTFDTESVSFPENFQLDFSAIAKGYAVDLVAELLESKGLENYLVEIGGEVRCRGVREDGEYWSLGIEDPLVDRNEQKLLAIVDLANKSLATSGNYRNYYERDGKTYAHIIDPRTGYNALHNLLSASVFADDCITADAYATAFMVLGLEESKKIIEADPELDALLVYRSEGEGLASYVSAGIRDYIELNKAE